MISFSFCTIEPWLLFLLHHDVFYRFVDSAFEIHNHVAAVRHFKKAPNSKVLEDILLNLLLDDLGIQRKDLFGCMFDCASVNLAVMPSVKLVFNNVMSFPCLAHTINSVGECFEAPNVIICLQAFVSLTSHSYEVRAIWKECTNHAPPSFSSTRWWSKKDQIKEALYNNWSSFLHILFSCKNSSAAVEKAQRLLSSVENQLFVLFEVALYVEVGDSLAAIGAFWKGIPFCCHFLFRKFKKLVSSWAGFCQGEVLGQRRC